MRKASAAPAFPPTPPRTLAASSAIQIRPQSFVPADFVESNSFARWRAKRRLPQYIRDWNGSHVREWAAWAKQTFPDVQTGATNWLGLDGCMFAAMTRSEFDMRVKGDGAGSMWKHFDVLRSNGLAVVPRWLERQETPASATAWSTMAVQEEARKQTITTTVTTGEKKKRVVLGKYEQGRVLLNLNENSNLPRNGNNGSALQLWRFLLDLLTDSTKRQDHGGTVYKFIFLIVRRHFTERLFAGSSAATARMESSACLSRKRSRGFGERPRRNLT